jgi:hypothetical protein
VGCWIGALLGAVVFILGILQHNEIAAAGFLLGLLGALLAFASRTTLVTSTRIADGVVRAQGAGKAFLASLPEWPGDR